MTQKLVRILTFHNTVVKFIPNLVKHIPIMTISLFASQYNVVSIVNSMQVGWLRHCSSVSGRGNRFHKVYIPAWGVSSLLFNSFTEGYSSWCCNLTRHFHVVGLGLRMSGTICPFSFSFICIHRSILVHVLWIWNLSIVRLTYCIEFVLT